MSIRISLAPEVENRLRQMAAQADVTVEVYIQHLVEQSISTSPVAHELPNEEWKRQFREWAASHKALPGPVDDDRESIYAGRDE